MCKCGYFFLCSQVWNTCYLLRQWNNLRHLLSSTSCEWSEEMLKLLLLLGFCLVQIISCPQSSIDWEQVWLLFAEAVAIRCVTQHLLIIHRVNGPQCMQNGFFLHLNSVPYCLGPFIFAHTFARVYVMTCSASQALLCPCSNKWGDCSPTNSGHFV